MRLKQVKLSGFKSFCDPSDLAFEDSGITMVVGPNGCGKSNVVDAVRWALGEQSPRLMRSSAMGDVIFSGSTSRKPVGRAEVTLLFDNSDRTAIERYNEYGEIAVTRRLYRSGESEYLINKLPCRLLDIRELIMDTGAAGRSYSIVEQGRVEEFVTASPQERRGFMEEAAGIVRYKTKRIAAEKKLEQTRQNLLRVEDVLAELGRQEEVLREQMETARAFRALQHEVAMIKGDLARLRHTASARACAALEGQAEALRQEATALEQRLLTENAQLERQALDQAQEEAALRQSRAALYAKEREIQQTDTQLALERQNLDNVRAWTTQLGHDLDELRRRQLQLAEQRQGQEREAQELESGNATAQAEIERVEAEHTERERTVQDVLMRLTRAQEQQLESHTQITGIENQQRFLSERLRDDEQRRSALHGRINAVSTELEQVRQTLEAQRARATELDAAEADADARAAELEAELETARDTLAAHRTQSETAERTLLECRSRLESLSEIEAGFEGFAEHVRSFLTWAQAHPQERDELGIVGPLADLVTVPAELATWSGDYLAPHLETVVIRSAAALPRLAEQVAALGTGGLRFLALDALPAANGNGNGNGSGHASLASLLQSGDEAGAVARALFGATRLLPADSAPYPLPSPIDAGHEWLAEGGAFHVDARTRVTLGQAGSPAAGLLRRRAEMAELDARLQGLQGERQRLQGEGARLAEQVSLLEARRSELGERRAELSLARKALEQEQGQGQREALRLEQVREAVQRETVQFDAELERYRTQQRELAGEMERWQAARVRLEGETATLREEAEAARAALHTVASDLTERKVEQGRLVSRLEALRARLAEQAAEQAQASAKLEETEAALAGQETRQQSAAQAIATHEAALKAHHEGLEALREAERERRQAFEALAERHRALGEQVRASQHAHEANQGRIHEIELKLTAERMRLEQHAEALAALPAREEPEPASDAADAAAAPDEKALERRLASAQAELQRMEGVNLGAPEEYQALSERLTFLRSQQADLNEAVEDLEASIRRMNAESRRRFRETFDQVNEKFQALFPKVFGGGEARLVMTDSDDPLVAGVDIVAQPPGKKLQGLSLLSGGEKALTAIALIFSFFLHKPSPFCLLDEVDAPLDDVNVTRFNHLIQSMTERAQFIIITHNKRTMEVADRLYGVTMEEAGVSKIVSVNLAGAA
jgi:chromosome segregation protein